MEASRGARIVSQDPSHGRMGGRRAPTPSRGRAKLLCVAVPWPSAPHVLMEAHRPQNLLRSGGLCSDPGLPFSSSPRDGWESLLGVHLPGGVCGPYFSAVWPPPRIWPSREALPDWEARWSRQLSSQGGPAGLPATFRSGPLPPCPQGLRCCGEVPCCFSVSAQQMVPWLTATRAQPQSCWFVSSRPAGHQMENRKSKRLDFAVTSYAFLFSHPFPCFKLRIIEQEETPGVSPGRSPAWR